VILNFRGEPAADVALDMPGAGPWRLRLNTDWSGYSPDFDDHHSTDIDVAEGDHEVGRGHAVLSIGPWSALIYTR
jgi:1,4-alpha-glucan branching enzyme